MGLERLLSAAALLFGMQCLLCKNAVGEPKEECIQEAFSKSSVSEEDRPRTLEILQETMNGVRERFRQGNVKGASMPVIHGIFAKKVTADQSIKDKKAVTMFIGVFMCCFSGKTLTWDRMRCPEAKEANNHRLTDEDLRKFIQAGLALARERRGRPATDDVLKRKFAEVLGSEEKGQVALEMNKVLEECQKRLLSEKTG